MNIISSSDVSWDYIINSKDCFDSYEIHNCEDLNFSHRVKSAKECYDVYWYWYMSELLYENVWSWWESYNLNFTSCVEWWSNNYYCFETKYCSHCFWCVWLRNKSYCILNKQYTKEEYEKLAPKIIEHMMKTWEWWEFFPSTLSPFWYNETVAEEYFPIPHPNPLPWGEREQKWMFQFTPFSFKGEGQGMRFNRSEYESPKPKVDKIIPASKLPEDIKEIPDDILNWAIECKITQKPFRIIKEELEFYRKHNIWVPRRHPDQRHLDRMKLRNPRKLYDRECDKCGKDIKTTYSPERKEIVYCEECYNKEIY